MSMIMNSIKAISLQFVKLLIFLIIVELGCKVIWSNLESKNILTGGRLVVASMLGNVSASDFSIVPNNYSLYWNNPEFIDPNYGHIYDRLGYRQNPLRRFDRPDFEILALGGSTTNMWPYVKDNAKIWTSALENYLNDISSENIIVNNAGLPFGTTAEMLSHYMFIGRYTDPDLIIYHGGGNDTVPLMFPNYTTDYSHFRWGFSGVSPNAIFAKVLENSYFAKVITSTLLSAYVTNGAPPLSSVEPSDALHRVLNDDPIAFRANLEAIILESASKGTNVVLVGFLQARRDFLTRNRPDLVGFEEVLIEGAKRHDQVMAELANQYENVYFLKLDQESFDDDWFQDNCHLTEEGEAEKARQIYDFISRTFDF